MTEDEAIATEQAAADVGHPEAFRTCFHGGELRGWMVVLVLEPLKAGGLTTFAPYDAEEWRQRIEQYWQDSASMTRRDQERAAQSDEHIWHE